MPNAKSQQISQWKKSINLYVQTANESLFSIGFFHFCSGVPLHYGLGVCIFILISLFQRSETTVALFQFLCVIAISVHIKITHNLNFQLDRSPYLLSGFCYFSQSLIVWTVYSLFDLEFCCFIFQILSSTTAPFAGITLWICVLNVKQIRHQQQAKNVPWPGEFAM